MSLLIWLPLISDLKNYGISNLSTVNVLSGVAQLTTGKLGKCYTATGTAANVATPFSHTFTSFTISAWVRFNGQRKAWNRAVGLGGSDCYMGLCCEHTNGTSLGFHAYKTISGTNTSVFDTYPMSILLNTWVHYAMCYDGTKYYLYQNGILITSNNANKSNITFNITNLYVFGGSASGYSPVSLNDVRIYDHCLSDKEVKEIAKGLVLHYKLDDSYAESSTILTSSLTSTAYNGATGKYGYNTDSNLGKIEGYFQGKDCIKIYTLTAGQTALPYAYFGNLFTSDGTNLPAYKALSFDYYTTVATTTWLNIYKLGSGEGTATWKTTNSDGIHSGTYTNSANSIIVKPNEWNHIEVIFHGTTTANAEWGYCINGPNHTSSADNYFLYANILLELNDHVTGYGANFHSNMIYDSSGFNNHGDTTNIIITNNTARYNVATVLNGTTVDSSSNTKVGAAYLRGFLPLTTPSALTVTWWGKNDAYGRGGIFLTTINSDPSECTDYSTTAIANWDSTFRIYNGSTAINFFSNFIKDGTWHYHTIIFDGATAKYYCDGILKISSALTGTLPSFNGFCMGLGKAGGVYRLIKQTVSDVRIYVTALTAEQVTELYHTSATIDNKGNIYARELVEK